MNKQLIIPLFACGLTICLGSCRKEGRMTEGSASHQETQRSMIAENSQKIHVASIEELYTAVNDPANAGARIILAPGTYVLNDSYPNRGRLELQEDMSLEGQPGQPEAVLIDQSALPNTSYSGPVAITGGIRLGKGVNKLKWLSLKGGLLSALAFAVVTTDLPSSETHVEISHVIVTSNGSRIGLDIRNRLPEHAGRKVYATVEHSEVTGFVNSLGFAISAQNVNGASNAIIQLELKGNYIHGNRIGVLAGNGAISRTTENSVIEIKSHADRLEGNGVALDPSGGVNSNVLTFSSNNLTDIELHATSIRDNNPPGNPALTPVNGALPGGIYAAGGYNTAVGAGGYNRASNNVLRMALWGCDISNNNGFDINAVGAWCAPATILAGTNNKVDIFLHGLSAQATVDFINSVPFEPAGTNVVNVIRN
ncbi:MAG TPA: hypothetical protein VGD17_14635 [Chitinophagaceae bacterium]